MEYGTVKEAVFKKRLNRFAAVVEVNGREEIAHVKNTGRLQELFLPDTTVYLKYMDHADRKTKWDLVSLENQGMIVNVDSQIPNYVFREWVENGCFRGDVVSIRPEFTYGDSRFDFCLKRKNTIEYVEIKGVTLLKDETAYFPDAPTERGVKHLRGLMRAVDEGYEASVYFVIQRKGAISFKPNDVTQPEFGKALREAAHVGVHIYAYDCLVTPESIKIDRPVKVCL